jgi:hypothetical protein
MIYSDNVIYTVLSELYSDRMWYAVIECDIYSDKIEYIQW